MQFYQGLRTSATTLVLLHSSAALDYEMKHINVKLFVSPPSKQASETATGGDFRSNLASLPFLRQHSILSELSALHLR